MPICGVNERFKLVATASRKLTACATLSTAIDGAMRPLREEQVRYHGVMLL